MSPTYYTFLEQGRPVRPSEQVLDALADALRLTAAERRYLRVLAHGDDPGAAVTRRPSRWKRSIPRWRPWSSGWNPTRRS